MDGTSKTVVYEPVKEENKEQPKADINEELMNKIKQDNSSLKEGMDSIKDQIQDLSENFEKLFDEMKSLKGGKK
jgi:archaellum component FlaC